MSIETENLHLNLCSLQHAVFINVDSNTYCHGFRTEQSDSDQEGEEQSNLRSESPCKRARDADSDEEMENPTIEAAKLKKSSRKLRQNETLILQFMKIRYCTYCLCLIQYSQSMYIIKHDINSTVAHCKSLIVS